MSHWVSNLNGLAGKWLDAVWQTSWKGAVVILLAGLICRLFPRIPARAKCWLWRLVFLQLLAAFFWTTPVRLPWLPAPQNRSTPGSSSQAFGSPSRETDGVGLPNRSERSDVGIQAFAVSTLDSNENEAGFSIRQFSIPSGLLALWSVGVFLCVFRLIGHWRSARRLSRDAIPVGDNSLTLRCHRLCKTMGILQAPQLLSSRRIQSPLLIGASNPRILLPNAEISNRSSDELCLMLAHELAHVRRNDLWWCWLPVISRLLFFFNPFVWLAHRECSLSQEIACDELAMSAAGSSRADFGKMLLEFATQPGQVFPAGVISAGIFESKQNLERRLIAMKSHGSFSRKGMVLITIAAVVMAGVGVVPWKLVAQSREQETANATDVASENEVKVSTGALYKNPQIISTTAVEAGIRAAPPGEDARDDAAGGGSKTEYYRDYAELPSGLADAVPVTTGNLRKQRDLYEQEIQMVEVLLDEAKKKFQAGAASLEAVLGPQKEILSLRRELARLDSDARKWNELVLEEVKLVEQQILSTQKAFQSGRATRPDVIRLQRELFDLKRQLAAAEVSGSNPESERASRPAENSEEAETIRSIRISPPASGTVTEVFVKPGDGVQKGASLVQLDSRQARSDLDGTYAQLELAHANLQLAKLEVKRAETTLERKTQLRSQSLISEEEITLAKHEKDVAAIKMERSAAELRLAEVQVNQAKLTIEELTIRSPINGTVISISTDEGERVTESSGEPVLILGSKMNATRKP